MCHVAHCPAVQGCRTPVVLSFQGPGYDTWSHAQQTKVSVSVHSSTTLRICLLLSGGTSGTCSSSMNAVLKANTASSNGTGRQIKRRTLRVEANRKSESARTMISRGNKHSSAQFSSFHLAAGERARTHWRRWPSCRAKPEPKGGFAWPLHQRYQKVSRGRRRHWPSSLLLRTL